MTSSARRKPRSYRVGVALALILVGGQPAAASTHIIAGYFMWRTQGLDWENEMPRFPWLGDLDSQGRHIGYDQTTEANILRSLQWAQAHGVRVMAPVWRGVQNNGDATMRSRLESLRKVLKDNGNLNVTWCVFLGNFVFPSPNEYDFGAPGAPTVAYRQFVDSLTTSINSYRWFTDPKYFRINGKPVLVLFRTKDFIGNYQGAVNEIRQYWGQNVYLIGMSAMWHKSYSTLTQAEIDRIKPYDAITAWNATAGTPNNTPDLQSVADFIGPKMATWRQNVPNLTVNGSSRKVDIGPTITCQYDKSRLTGNNAPTRWARSRQDFEALVQVAKDNLDPDGIGGTSDNFVWLQTLNEWPEGTPCEPTVLGTGHPYGHPGYQDNYGFEFYEVLRNKLDPTLTRTPRDAILISPTYNQTVPNTTPTFRWDTVNANPAVINYRLKIFRTSNALVAFDRDLGNVTSYTLPWGHLERGVQYTWQVRVENTWSAPLSLWSLQRQFTVAP